MLSALREAINRLKQDYPIVDSLTAEGMDIRVTGIADTFRVSIADGEYTISTDEWHEHIEKAENLEGFLRWLLTGKAWITVTYRGNKPTGHIIEAILDGRVQTLTGTAEIWQPFWRRKRRRRLDYRLTG